MSIFKRLFAGGSGGDETQDFDGFVEASMEGLRLQSEGHQGTWGFGEEDRWDFAQDDGELIFTFPDRVARTPAQIVGSFDGDAGSWMWSWANASIAEHLSQDAIRACEYGEQRGIERLTAASWPGEELDGWHMAALTNRLCERNGVYRGPAGSAFIFFTFGEVRIASE